MGSHLLLIMRMDAEFDTFASNSQPQRSGIHRTDRGYSESVICRASSRDRPLAQEALNNWHRITLVPPVISRSVCKRRAGFFIFSCRPLSSHAVPGYIQRVDVPRPTLATYSTSKHDDDAVRVLDLAATPGRVLVSLFPDAGSNGSIKSRARRRF